MICCATIVFSGRVQGVGFRAHVKRLADSMGVKGTVENLDDGTVRAVVEAATSAGIENFCLQVKKKAFPWIIEVKSAEILEQFEKKEPEFSDFKILF